MTWRAALAKNLPPSIANIAQESLKKEISEKHPQPPVMMSVTSNNNVLKELFSDFYSLDAIFAKSSKPPLPVTISPDDLEEIRAERAAIMEFDGGLPRAEVEHLVLLEYPRRKTT